MTAPRRARQNRAATTGALILILIGGQLTATMTTATALSGPALSVTQPAAIVQPVTWAKATSAKTPTITRVTVKAARTKVTAGKKVVLTLGYIKKNKKVAKASVRLQASTTGSWKTIKKAQITKGKSKVTVKPTKTTRYRVKVAKMTSKTTKVTVVKKTSTPVALKAATSFTVAGSGYGHGVGMSQYGAYQMALTGKNATQILTHYYTGTTVAAKPMPSQIAVQIFGPEPYSFSGYADSASATTFSVTQGSWRLVVPSTGKVLYTGSASQKATLSASGSNVKATVVGGASNGTAFTQSAISLQWSGTDEFSPSGVKAIADISGTHGTYRHGQFTATVIKNKQGVNKLNVVNELPLTQYLYGIAEMPSSWGKNGKSALAAQAITARSFALVKMKSTTNNINGTRKSACNCHVVDDVRDQYFSGWSKEGEKSGSTTVGAYWTAAVDSTVSATSAQALTYNGAVISTYYYSSSGGRSANSEDVWSSSVPYLRSVEDSASLKAPGNSLASWTSTVPAARLASLFKLPNIARIEITERYSSGQVKTVRATATNGQTAVVTGKADVLRLKLGSLKSAWLKSFTPVY